MRYGKTSVSEPLMTCRNRPDGVRTGDECRPWEEFGRSLKPGPIGTRLVGGVSPYQALVWNVGTCRPDAKGDVQVGGPHKDQSTDAGHRGGAARSRDEGSVMGLDRRGCGIRPGSVVNR